MSTSGTVPPRGGGSVLAELVAICAEVQLSRGAGAWYVGGDSYVGVELGDDVGDGSYGW